ncbi:OmpA family protein [Roseovarius sp. D22-M7]
MTSLAGGAQAQDQEAGAESYVATVWIDPDGCEHWVMDDGAEGYMSPHLTRDGTPVCHERDLCADINTDQMFRPDSSEIDPASRERLRDFFRRMGAVSYTVEGHTDSRASDAYNMRLSQRRAEAVAGIARSEGARVSDVRGYGERKPRASNETAAGMAQNRRVEIQCWR